MATLKQKGLQVVQLTPAEKEVFFKASDVDSIWKEIVKPWMDKAFPGQNMTQVVQAELAKVRAEAGEAEEITASGPESRIIPGSSGPFSPKGRLRHVSSLKQAWETPKNGWRPSALPSPPSLPASRFSTATCCTSRSWGSATFTSTSTFSASTPRWPTRRRWAATRPWRFSRISSSAGRPRASRLHGLAMQACCLLILLVFLSPVIHTFRDAVRFPEWSTLVPWFNVSWLAYAMTFSLFLCVYHMLRNLYLSLGRLTAAGAGIRGGGPWNPASSSASSCSSSAWRSGSPSAGCPFGSTYAGPLAPGGFPPVRGHDLLPLPRLGDPRRRGLLHLRREPAFRFRPRRPDRALLLCPGREGEGRPHRGGHRRHPLHERPHRFLRPLHLRPHPAPGAATREIRVPEAVHDGRALFLQLPGLPIPPSVPALIYCLVAQQSVAALFLATVFPGLLLALGYCILNYFIVDKYTFPSRGNEPVLPGSTSRIP